MRKTSLECVYKLAKKDPSVIFIGSDLGPGVLDDMKSEMPHRFFMEGVSEQHIIGMAAGLAMEGYKPYVNTIATFLTRRCFEQIAIDLCLHNLPVRLIANGGGLVYAPLGPTHLATDDIGILRTLPNMTIVAPSDADEMKRLMSKTLDWPHPIYIRLAKGGDPIISQPQKGFEIGKAILFGDPIDGLYISTGIMTHKCISAIEKFSAKGRRVGVLHMHTVKPLDLEALMKHCNSVKKIVTVEEHSKIGGLGSSVLETLSENMPQCLPKVTVLGLGDHYSEQYGSQQTLMNYYGLTMDRIVETMNPCCEE